jgi:hypothetical protein
MSRRCTHCTRYDQRCVRRDREETRPAPRAAQIEPPGLVHPILRCKLRCMCAAFVVCPEAKPMQRKAGSRNEQRCSLHTPGPAVMPAVP